MLIRPPAYQILHSLSYFGAIPPIGLAYIAAVLREAGHPVCVIDAVGLAPEAFTPVEGPVPSLYLHGLLPENVVGRIPSDARLIGITHMFHHEWPVVKAIAEAARARCPDAFIVIGGENATADHARILATCAAVDACVLGEGEATAVELAARLAAGSPLDGMPGLARRAGDARLAPRLTNLHAIPLPAWDLFPMEAYFGSANVFGVHRGRTMPILSTRGCPFRCTFCSSPQMWTTRYVTRPPTDVVDEIATYVTRYGVTNVDFCDLTAIVKRSWILEFCAELQRRDLRLSWQLPVGTRSEALDAEVLQALRASGCRNVTYAPESGSERLLADMKKQIRLPRLFDSLRAAIAADLIVRLNIIIGHPKETRADVRATFVFLMRTAWMGCQDASVMIFAPYPGSEDYEQLRAAGQLDAEGEDAFVALARSGRSSHTFNPIMGRMELLLTQLFLLVAFYSVACVRSPTRLFRLAASVVSGAEDSHVEQLFRTKLGLVRQVRAADARRSAASGTAGVSVRQAEQHVPPVR